MSERKAEKENKKKLKISSLFSLNLQSNFFHKLFKLDDDDDDDDQEIQMIHGFINVKSHRSHS